MSIEKWTSRLDEVNVDTIERTDKLSELTDELKFITSRGVESNNLDDVIRILKKANALTSNLPVVDVLQELKSSMMGNNEND